MESSLFVIDSSPAIRRLVEKAAEHGGYQVKAFSDGPTALEEASRLKPQIIIADYHLEGLTFTTFCEKLNELDLIPDTLLVLLVNSSDRCDETSMRSRGVRGFLKKPLQSGQIVEMIQELKNNHSPGNTKKATRANKSWPPQTQMTNLEEPFAMDSDDQEEEMLDLLPELPEAVAAPQPPPPESKSAATASAAAAGSVAHKKPEVADPVKPKPAPQPQPVTTASPVPGNGLTPQLETAMRGFLAQLVQALDSRSDSQQGGLTEIIMQQMGSHIQRLVQAEVSSQLAAAKPGEQATKAAQEAVQQMLPHMVPEHLTAMESSIQQSLRETTGRVVEELTERLVKDMTAAAVQKHLPEMIAQHLGSVENWVKEAAKEAASTHARESADQAVREIASETIRQLVPTVVPDLAESQIKKEIERLTTPT